MPNWKDILDEAQAAGSTYDVIRRQYLAKLHEKTGRNVIIYYSGWLQKPAPPSALSLNDGDKNGFMAAIHKLDRSKGLDLILHTPGGDVAATESLVHYLRNMFPDNLRAIVPQLALSAGTMVSLACKEIVMGKHSSLGPIDPQIGGMPAHGILEEFEQAQADINAGGGAAVAVWQPILAKYPPTLIGECQKAIHWANDMVKEWLVTGMFAGADDAEEQAERVVSELGDHALTKSHSRHISAEKARGLGVKIVALEDDPDLQEGVLTVHHATIHTLSSTNAVKIIENHLGVAHVSTVGPA